MEKNNSFSFELKKVADTTLSVIPLSVHCSSACNLVIWSCTKIAAETIIWTYVRFYIAQKMDQLADLLRDHQCFSPLVAIIDIDECSDEKLIKEWLQLSGDQDWHRGRFIVQVANTKGYPTAIELIDSWTGALQVSPYTPKKIDNNRFKKLLLETIPFAKIPKEIEPQLFGRYTDNVLQALEQNQAEKIAQKWQQEIINDLNNLLGKDFFEGTNNDSY